MGNIAETAFIHSDRRLNNSWELAHMVLRTAECAAWGEPMTAAQLDEEVTTLSRWNEED